MRIRPLVLLPPLVFAALAVLFWFGLRQDPTQLPTALAGRQAPAVPATTLTGSTPLTDAMLRQPGVKLVNFWASWCPPCRAEHPTLTALAAEGIPVYGVDLKDREADASAFLAQHGNPFAALATDPQGRTAIEWGVTAPPETFILGPDGTVLYRHQGPLVREDYTGRFRPELDKALTANP